VRDRKVFCTLRYYRAKYPGMAYSLDDLASHFRIDQIIERYVRPLWCSGVRLFALPASFSFSFSFFSLFGWRPRRTHGALVDAEICARVYQQFLDAL
jgi:DNA polymerase III epsilon subunit-like protein